MDTYSVGFVVSTSIVTSLNHCHVVAMFTLFHDRKASRRFAVEMTLLDMCYQKYYIAFLKVP